MTDEKLIPINSPPSLEFQPDQKSPVIENVAAPDDDLLFETLSRNLISLTEAAQLTGYAEDYLRQRARRGLLKAIKIGRNWITTRTIIQGYRKHSAGPNPHLKETKLSRKRKLRQKISLSTKGKI